MIQFPEHLTYAETLLDQFFAFLQIMLWLHIVLGVTISPDPLLQKANGELYS